MISQNGAEDCINYADKNRCRCLADGYCPGRCKFYKNQKQQTEEIKKVFARLRKLPKEQQLMITDKYYSRKTVWTGKE